MSNKLDDLPKQNANRNVGITVKSAVNAFFAWAKSGIAKVAAGGATYKGLQYCINQEKFLHAFLKNGNVSMDNNLRTYEYMTLLLEELAKTC